MNLIEHISKTGLWTNIMTMLIKYFVPSGTWTRGTRIRGYPLTALIASGVPILIPIPDQNLNHSDSGIRIMQHWTIDVQLAQVCNAFQCRLRILIMEKMSSPILSSALDCMEETFLLDDFRKYSALYHQCQTVLLASR